MRSNLGRIPLCSAIWGHAEGIMEDRWIIMRIKEEDKVRKTDGFSDFTLVIVYSELSNLPRSTVLHDRHAMSDNACL